METRVVRLFEIGLAVAALFYGVRTAVPLSPEYMWWTRIPFGLLVLSPGVVLLWFAHTARRRAKALLGVAASNIYVTAAVIGSDWTRFGSAAAPAVLSVMAFILHAGARAEGRDGE